MDIKSVFNRCSRSYKLVDDCHKEANEFFLNFDLEYSLTYCKGDGLMILDCNESLCGHISEDQLYRLSKSKNREQALKVLKEIEFNY